MNSDMSDRKNVQISFQDLHKSYLVGKLPVYALRGITGSVLEGEFVAIMGPSGSGKSTLLHLLGGLDKPTQGSIIISEKEITYLSSNQLSDFRMHNIGFIFQTFNLIPSISALENVLLPIVFSGRLSRRDQLRKGKEVLSLVGLSDRFKHYPGELSGGEQQRVAIARAIANDPNIILADEPTGDLDSNSGIKILELLKDLNNKGQTIVMVTHDERLASYATRKLELFDGKLKIN